jgi:Lipid A 3-O-deacylase (PagL)
MVAWLPSSAFSKRGDTALGKDGEPGAESGIIQPRPASRRSPPEREIAIEGFVSYGNWQIFAAGESEALYTAGFEYDRNSWGRFVGAQMDYVAEVLPFVLLRQPRFTDEWGNRLSKDNVLLPGFGFSPIGLRMQWRSNKAFKPYFTVKGGAVAFTQKALSPDATYQNFSISESIGFYTRMSERWDMRVGLFGDYHFSNAFITSYNPGLDVMNTSIAFSYHLGRAGVPR